MTNIQFSIPGQCPSGKNSIVITRTGHRFPSKRFADWKKQALDNLQLQMVQYKKIKFPLDAPVTVGIKYIPSDRRRRDVPGIIDAVWHVLEKAGIVTDDKHLGGTGKVMAFLHKLPDKKNTSVNIVILGEQ